MKSALKIACSLGEGLHILSGYHQPYMPRGKVPGQGSSSAQNPTGLELGNSNTNFHFGPRTSHHTPIEIIRPAFFLWRCPKGRCWSDDLGANAAVVAGVGIWVFAARMSNYVITD
jgi:hypothetical protein